VEIGAGSYLLGFGAGVLSTLSPCVLPLIPLVAASAAGAHRFGVAALALGLAGSFAVLGTALATLGLAAGLDAASFRGPGAVLLAAIGIVLVSPWLQTRFAVAAGIVGDAGNGLIGRLHPDGLGVQFVIGLLLGTVWTPCVGPTLGAASLLAGQRAHWADAALVMLLFGIGAALPLALIGTAGRRAMSRWRGRLSASGAFGKTALGWTLIVIAVAVVTGVDKTLETLLVALSPDWLTDLTVRY